MMADWAVVPETRTLLEPAVGTGALVRAALALQPGLAVTAFDRDPVVMQAFREWVQKNEGAARVDTILDDFLMHGTPGGYDSVLMNPPYVRHRDLNYGFDLMGKVGQEFDLRVSRLSNLYVPFTLRACMALRPGGRASILVPSEWMNANSGQSMKEFLVGRGFLRQLAVFAPGTLVFDDALVTASVLFVERPPG